MAISGNCDFTDCFKQSSSPIYDGNNYNSARVGAQTEWTATATVKHASNDTLLGFTDPIVKLSSPGNARIRVERMLSFDGACSATVRTFNVTGDCSATAGTHYTAQTVSFSWADGEAGVKYIDVNVNSFPRVGLSLIGVEMATNIGCEIYHPRVYIWCDDGGVNPNATLVTASTQSDLETECNNAAAGSLIYARSTGGDWTRNQRNTGQDYGAAANITNGNGTATAPVIVAAYPGETPKIDPANAGTHDAAGNNVTCGFFFHGTPKHFWIQGFEITRTSYSGVNAVSLASRPEGLYVLECNIHDVANQAISLNGNVGSDFDNIGGIRLDDSVHGVAWNNTINKIYDPNGSSNNIDAELRGLHSGIHGYRTNSFWACQNTIHTVGRGIFGKQPDQTGSPNLNTGHHCNKNYIKLCESFAIEMGVAGAGTTPYKNVVVNENVAVLNGTTGANVDLLDTAYNDDVNAQPTGFSIHNNTLVGGDWLLRNRTVANMVVYSNCCRDLGGNLSIERNRTYNTSVDYSDYNMFNNTTATPRWNTDRNGVSPNSYNTLAAWQGAYPTDTQLINDAGTNTIETAPTFTNEVGEDYTTTTGNTQSAGRFSQDIGIGSTVVGAI